jgi:predicted amidophosphoribosyltransferase
MKKQKTVCTECGEEAEFRCTDCLEPVCVDCFEDHLCFEDAVEDLREKMFEKVEK